MELYYATATERITLDIRFLGVKQLLVSLNLSQLFRCDFRIIVVNPSLNVI